MVMSVLLDENGVNQWAGAQGIRILKTILSASRPPASGSRGITA
jgi:hypothetical protein